MIVQCVVLPLMVCTLLGYILFSGQTLPRVSRNYSVQKCVENEVLASATPLDEQARYQWIAAANYLMMSTTKSGPKEYLLMAGGPFFGVLSWSQDFSEISYPIFNSSNINGIDHNVVKVNRNLFLDRGRKGSVRLYATGKTCLGLSVLLRKYLASLAKADEDHLQPLESPCHGKNRTGVIDFQALLQGEKDGCLLDDDRVDGINRIQYRGSGDVGACGRFLASMELPAGFYEAKKMPIPAEATTRFFVFTPTLNLAKLLSKAAADALPASASSSVDLPTFRALITERICSKGTKTQMRHEQEDGQEDFCLQANLLHHLLVDIYGIGNLLPNVRVAFDLGGGHNMDWKLGYLLEKSHPERSPRVILRDLDGAATRKLLVKPACLYIFLVLIALGTVFLFINYFTFVD